MCCVMRLSESEIKARMVELRNLRKLHTGAIRRVSILKEENKLLKERVGVLELAFDQHEKIITDLRLQLEELRTIVFGRKRKKEEKYDIDDTPTESMVITDRDPESYKRSTPKEEEVAKTESHPIDSCNHCGSQISEKEVVTYFVEDIPLPQKKAVTKYIVEKGYCEICKIWNTKEPLPNAKVTLGSNVKRYVTYMSVICRQSYGQIQQLLDHVYNFEISQGEIAKILEKEGEKMRPEYERLKVKIRGEPSIHLDETGWNLFIGDGYKRYAWTMTGGQSKESIFVLGKTRGKGNATDLIGDSKAIVVSDDYGVYRNIENDHQLCCAHILRKLRDLAISSEIKYDVHDYCVDVYKSFKKIYIDINDACLSPDPQLSYDSLFQRLKTFSIIEDIDPAKLVRIKHQMSARTANYLTCLLHPNVASDNNIAERSLRHLILKRKISFGSFREKTAETLAILASVLLSRRQNGTLSDYLRGV